MSELSAVTQKFILHWGEMGAKWGINRTVAQIHALLYLSPRPLNAEEIAQTLCVARSNVSASLKELQNWGVVRVVHVMGDRRDHFETMRDAWEMFRVILAERKRREIDPTLEILRDCASEIGQADETDSHTRTRLGELQDFFESMNEAYGQLSELPTDSLKRFAKLGKRLQKALKMLGG